MDLKYRNTIYDRLLEIRFSIDMEMVPDPADINKKIGECHSLIEEIEHFSIQVSKEISVMQQALNNATAEYEVKKSTQLREEKISKLPSIKDREAAVNLILSEERAKITEYENDVTDLNNLLKVLNLKIKNLNRANMDIKMQIRVLEAQAKIVGKGPNTDYAVKSIVDELAKSKMDEDSFGEAEAEEAVEEEKVVDPSEGIDMDNLLGNKEEEKPSEEEVVESLIEPVPELNPDEDGDTPMVIEDTFVDVDLTNVIEEPTKPEPEINLDDAIDTSDEETIIKKGGTEEKAQIKTETKVEVVENQKENHTVETGMDLDELLGSFNTQK